nr:type II toxin-antitoxin system YhaV family toxin [uncultured Pseudomonas sp.]
MSQSSVTIYNGWAIYSHSLFVQRLDDLVTEVERLAASDPDDYHHHPIAKLLEAVDHQITHCVPSDPTHKDFLVSTLGKDMGHWRRVKKALPQRYRLFFQFRSSAPKTIIYAWLNDQSSLRRKGDRADVYEVFKRMVKGSRMPNSYEDLLAASKPGTVSDQSDSEPA